MHSTHARNVCKNLVLEPVLLELRALAAGDDRVLHFLQCRVNSDLVLKRHPVITRQTFTYTHHLPSTTLVDLEKLWSVANYCIGSICLSAADSNQ